jgi:Spy/CpxP family protein refolding chaperone
MKKARVIVAVLAAVLLATGSVYAQEQKNFQKRGEEKKGNIYRELRLTPDQEKRLEDNRKAQHEEMQRLREAYKADLEKLQVKLKDPAVTRAAVAPLVNEIKVLKAKQVDSMVNGIFLVKSILTPEQYARFNELMEKKIKDKKNHPGKPGESPKGPPPETE